MSLAAKLGLGLVDQRWRLDALCIEHPEVNWFPSRHAGNDGVEAKAICARCPVRVECLDYALAFRLDRGVWGGTSGAERRRLKRERRR